MPRLAIPGLAIAGLLLGGCRGSNNTAAYLAGGATARRALEASVVNPRNAYSALRLARYQTGGTGDWARLPVFNPPSEPIPANELDQPAGASATALSPAAARLALPADGTALGDDALLALGRLSDPAGSLHASGADVAGCRRAVRAVDRSGGRRRGARARADARRIRVAGRHVRDLSHRARRTTPARRRFTERRLGRRARRTTRRTTRPSPCRVRRADGLPPAASGTSRRSGGRRPPR
jgi:hypothetical protein